MAGYPYPTYARGALPTTRVHEAPVHRCGRCANPYTYGNPNCVNATGNWNLGRTPRI